MPDYNHIITSVYILPFSSSAGVDGGVIQLNQEYINIVEDFFYTYKDFSFLLAGDFNLPRVTWNNSSYSFNNDCTNLTKDCCNLVMNSFKKLNMNQFNNFVNYKNNILDLIFTNLDIDISCCIDPVSVVDVAHPPLHLQVKMRNFNSLFSKLNFNFSFFDYKKGDFNSINNNLNQINWDQLFYNNNIEDAAKKFYNILNENISKFIPLSNYITSTYPCCFHRS